MPDSDPKRIQHLDVIRGFALLGVLLMNMQAFAMVQSLYMNPHALGPASDMDKWLWTINHVIGDQKFMTIFSMLFGAGVYLMTESVRKRTGKAAGVHYRRMGWLCFFGLIHGILLWFGDILFLYSIAGAAVFLVCRVRPWLLLAMAVPLILIPAGLTLLISLLLNFASPSDLTELEEMWTPTPEMVQEEIDSYRGSWIEQQSARFELWLEMFVFLFLFGWRVLGQMLLGVWLLRTGVFAGEKSRRFYVGLALGGLSCGFSLAVLGLYLNVGDGWTFEGGFGALSLCNYFGSIFAALGYVGLIVLVVKSGWCAWLTRRLAAVGRMAFTNYIMHTVICTSLFYGFGFGLFMKTDRLTQLGIVIAIWVAQLLYSPWWLARFRFGPLEWLWRTLTYLRLKP